MTDSQVFRAGLVCAGPSAIWLGQEMGRFLVRAPRALDAPGSVVELPGEPFAQPGVRIQAPIVSVAVGDEIVWALARFAKGVVRIEEATGRVLSVVPCAGAVLAADRDQVWVAGGGDGVLRVVDATRNRIREVATLGGDLRDVLVAFGSVWVVDNADGHVVRMDPSTGDVIEDDHGILPRVDHGNSSLLGVSG